MLLRGLIMTVVMAVTCRAEEAPMAECREGDVRCAITVAHRLFDEKKYAEAISWFSKVSQP